jgi:hypothetical protein
MNKVVTPDSFGFTDPIARLVDVHDRGGISRDWMVKRAAAPIFSAFDGYKPASGHSLIHLIAMGDAEAYGANRNGDIFYSTGRQLELPEPNWKTIKTASGAVHARGPDTFGDCTKVGNRETHNTFVTHAKVYKHHKHASSDPVFGRVVASAHNEPMHRVELLIDVPNDTWGEELQKLASGDSPGFSMACAIPFDICSVCGHKAKTRNEYCPHLTGGLTSMLKSGHVVSAVNDGMRFFDISRVIRPADRIAYALEKAAALGTVTGGAELAELMGYSDDPSLYSLPGLRNRLDLLAKAAEMEKTLPLTPVAAKTAPAVARRVQRTAALESLHGQPAKQASLFRALADATTCLPFDDFCSLVYPPDRLTKSAAAFKQARELLPSMFELMAARSLQVVTNQAFSTEYAYASPSAVKLAAECAVDCGMLPDQVIARATRAALSGPATAIKAAQASPDSSSAAETLDILSQYASYKLAFLERVQQSQPQTFEAVMIAAVLQGLVQ